MPVKSCSVAVVKNSSKSKIIPASEVGKLRSYDFADVTAPGQRVKRKSQSPKLTAADIERIQEQARVEAYEQGRKEGFEAGRLEAIEQFRTEFTARVEQLDQFLRGFSRPFEELDEQVEHEIVELVISMVRQLVRREVKMDPSHIVGVVREAMSVLPVSSQEVTLVLNPADADLVREAFAIGNREQIWNIVEDPVLNRGGCRVVSADSQVDATLESRLDALIAPLLSDERVQGPDDNGDVNGDDGQ